MYIILFLRDQKMLFSLNTLPTFSEQNFKLSTQFLLFSTNISIILYNVKT